MQDYCRAIRQCRSLSAAIALHARISADGCIDDPGLAALLIKLYTNLGSVDRARSLFESLPRKTALCWNFAIDAYAGDGSGDESLFLFRRMALEGEKPDRHTFVRVLSSCRMPDHGKLLHRQISSLGMESDVMLQNSLVAMYGRCQEIDHARSVFLSIREKTTVSWNAMISANANNRHFDEAITTYNSMIAHGAEADAISLALVLGVCHDLDVGKLIIAKTLASYPEILASPVAQTAVVSFYSRCNRVDLAREFLESSNEKLASVAVWNAMIAGYVHGGYNQEALGAYRSIDLEGLRPDRMTFATVLGACSRIGDFETGNAVYSRALCSGFHKKDLVLLVAAVSFYGKCGRVADARRVFDGIEKKSVVVWSAMIGVYAQNGYRSEAMELYEAMQVPANEVTYANVLAACSSLQQGKTIHRHILASKLKNIGLVLETALVKMYAGFDDCVSARDVFDQMEKRDLVSWNTMLGGYVQNSRGREALELFKEMKLDPDLTTISTLLGACSLLGDLASGKMFHELLIEKKMARSDAFLCSSLMNMYAKCGSFARAREVFQTARACLSGSVVLWNTYLAALAHAGYPKQSLEALLEMELEGVRLDSTSFVCALVACSHAGLFQRGKLLFEVMVLDHFAKPTLEQYVCMADLLGRSGRLEFARELLDSMPFEADGVAWKALLGTFRGNISLEGASVAAQRLVEMDAGLGLAFVLLSNVYSFSTCDVSRENECMGQGFVADQKYFV